jgi:hypothetical protein
VIDARLASESCLPTNSVVDPGENVSVSFTITNHGVVAITNLTVTLLPGTGVSGPSATQVVSVLALGGTSVRTFNFAATGQCGGTVLTRLQLQQGTTSLGTYTNSFAIGTPAVVYTENFDGVAAPGLPAGWVTSAVNAGTPWISSTAQRDTFPNAAFTEAPDEVGESLLTSPSFLITTTTAEATFRHWYDFENTYDGGVLEISLGAGPFLDILAAGGSFLAGGYTDTISSGFGNSLGGRSAWSGPSGGFVTTRVRLPAAASGQNVRLRWRAGTDSLVSGPGWYVDSLSASSGYNCCSGYVPPVIVNLRRVGGDVAFSFQSVAGQTYQVESKGSLSSPGWQVLQTINGDGTLKHFTNSVAATNRFFQLRSP